MKQLLLLAFLFISLALQAQGTKSYKLEFYNADEYKDYAVISASDKPLLEPSSFVCELVNVFDPDTKFEIVKFDFTVKTKGGEQKYSGMTESELLEKIKQTESLPDGSPAAVITVTKVYYMDSKKVEKSLSIDNYGYAVITVH
jgi:hypothetical protein